MNQQAASTIQETPGYTTLERSSRPAKSSLGQAIFESLKWPSFKARVWRAAGSTICFGGL